MPALRLCTRVTYARGLTSDRRLLALGGDLVRVGLAVEAVLLGRAPDAHEPRHLAALLGREEALLRRRQGAAVRAVPDDLGVVPACVFGGASNGFPLRAFLRVRSFADARVSLAFVTA